MSKAFLSKSSECLWSKCSLIWSSVQILPKTLPSNIYIYIYEWAICKRDLQRVAAIKDQIGVWQIIIVISQIQLNSVTGKLWFLTWLQLSQQQLRQASAEYKLHISLYAFWSCPTYQEGLPMISSVTKQYCLLLNFIHLFLTWLLPVINTQFSFQLTMKGKTYQL